VGKIAFNYLAWRMGPDFVRGRSFNPIREYIRYGTDAGYPLVNVLDRPILFEDTMASRQTVGHLVTATWTPDNQHIVGQVSLFNAITYGVILARDYAGVWLPVVSGHHFGHQTGTISRLVGARVA
jgi:hypothetical protein